VKTPVLAAMASLPRRAEYLPQVLASLLPQVDKLAIFLNGYDRPPECVTELQRSGRATVECSTENLGAEKKMRWAGDWGGIYCTVDDDTIYPPNYVETMVAAVVRWNGCALVSGHGRSFRPKATSVHDLMPGSAGLFYARIDSGRWVNHAGTGVMAWDARKIKMPTEWPERNLADMQVALWAQRSAVPIWLIAHQAHWIKSLAPLDPKGIWKTSQAQGHSRRNEALRRQSRERGWKIYQAGPA
jgi:hypothetical protein